MCLLHKTVIAPDIFCRLSNTVSRLVLDGFVQFIFAVVDLSYNDFEHLLVILWFHCLPGKKCNRVFKINHVFENKLTNLNTILRKSSHKNICWSGWNKNKTCLTNKRYFFTKLEFDEFLVCVVAKALSILFFKLLLFFFQKRFCYKQDGSLMFASQYNGLVDGTLKNWSLNNGSLGKPFSSFFFHLFFSSFNQDITFFLCILWYFFWYSLDFRLVSNESKSLFSSQAGHLLKRIEREMILYARLQ